MKFYSIKSNEDIEFFLQKTNSLHDGYIIGVQYENCGITHTENCLSFDSDKTKLTLRVLVTSFFDAVVEMEFEGLSEWQLKDDRWDITDITLNLCTHNSIVWADNRIVEDAFTNGSYVIAKSMKWRIVE